MKGKLSTRMTALLAAGGVALGGTGVAVATGLGAGAASAKGGKAAGHRGLHPRGPRAIVLSMAAMHPDPPAGDQGRPPGPPPRPPGGGPGGPGGEHGTPAQHLQHRSEYFAAIAKALGKDGSDVTAAVRGAISTELQKDVTAGRLTSAQADQILSYWDQGGPPKDAAKPKPPAGKPPLGKRPSRDEIKQAVATFRAEVASKLGVSTDQLTSAITTAAQAEHQEYAGSHS